MKKKMSQQLGRTRPLPWPAEFRVAYPSMTLLPELVQRMDQLSAAGAIIDTATPLRASRQRVMVPRSPPVEGVSGRGETETHPPRPGEEMPVPRSPPAQTWEPVVATTGQRERGEEYSCGGENEKQVTARTTPPFIFDGSWRLSR
jgi:hypothetical protein